MNVYRLKNRSDLPSKHEVFEWHKIKKWCLTSSVTEPGKFMQDNSIDYDKVICMITQRFSCSHNIYFKYCEISSW